MRRVGQRLIHIHQLYLVWYTSNMPTLTFSILIPSLGDMPTILWGWLPSSTNSGCLSTTWDAFLLQGTFMKARFHRSRNISTLHSAGPTSNWGNIDFVLRGFSWPGSLSWQFMKIAGPRTKRIISSQRCIPIKSKLSTKLKEKILMSLLERQTNVSRFQRFPIWWCK